MPLPLADPDSDPRYRCFCGFFHIVTGTQICLALYVIMSGFSLVFGMKSTLTWLIVPLCVVGLATYALVSRRHKYLYPFLIISVVHQLVALLMALIVVTFAASTFDTVRKIIGHSLGIQSPSYALCMLVVSGTVAGCLIAAMIHVWQTIVIYRCLQYYEDCYNRLDDGCTNYDTTLGESRWEQTGDYSSGHKSYSNIA